MDPWRRGSKGFETFVPPANFKVVPAPLNLDVDSVSVNTEQLHPVWNLCRFKVVTNPIGM